jgi:hypothetical protein
MRATHAAVTGERHQNPRNVQPEYARTLSERGPPKALKISDLGWCRLHVPLLRASQAAPLLHQRRQCHLEHFKLPVQSHCHWQSHWQYSRPRHSCTLAYEARETRTEEAANAAETNGDDLRGFRFKSFINCLFRPPSPTSGFGLRPGARGRAFMRTFLRTSRCQPKRPLQRLLVRAKIAA